MALYNPDVCHAKRTYQTVYDANLAILHHYRQGSPQLTHYRCPVCGYYHLTSRIEP